MSGEKNSKTDKALEIWHILLQNQYFINGALKIKKYVLDFPKDFPGYYFRREFLFQEHNIILTKRLGSIFDEYVFDKKIKDLGEHFSVRLQTPSEEELQKSKRSFIKLWIYDGVSRDETIDYLKKNWKIIKRIIGISDIPKVKRIRRIENKKQNGLILKFNKLSTQELWNLLGETPKRKIYREILIKRLLEQEGYSTSFESIKMVISRNRKYIRNA